MGSSFASALFEFVEESAVRFGFDLRFDGDGVGDGDWLPLSDSLSSFWRCFDGFDLFLVFFVDTFCLFFGFLLVLLDARGRFFFFRCSDAGGGGRS